MLDLSIIIVSYNTAEFLKKCLVSIAENVKGISFEVIVVDNASTDKTPLVISGFKFPVSGFKIILNKKNVGFSKANNQGIKVSQKSRYVLFLNSDTLIQGRTIEEMIRFMDTHKDVGASTCKLLLPNGKIDDASHRGFPTPWNAFSHFSGLEKLFPKSNLFAGYTLGWMNPDKVHEIDALAGAFMLVRREAGEDVLWWDEDYFFYGEDIDFCYKLKRKGWKIYYVPSVSILHFKGVSGGIKSVSKQITTATKETKIRSSKSRFNAMRIFYKKHYEDKYPKIINKIIYRAIALKEKLS